MYVCICNAVTDKDIIEEVTLYGATTLADLQETLGVATCCGCCAEEATALIVAHKDDSVNINNIDLMAYKEVSRPSSLRQVK